MSKGTMADASHVPPHQLPTEDLLLEAAKRLFAEQGYEGVALREIAAEAGVNPSLVSYHFGGKDRLYRACLERSGRAKLDSVKRILSLPKNPEEFELRLRLFTEDLFESYLNDPQAAAIAQREIEKVSSVAEDVLRATYLRVFEAIVAYISEGQRRKWVTAQTDPRLSALLYFAMLAHLTRMDPVHARHLDIRLSSAEQRAGIIDQIMGIFFSGIRSHQ